jgi:hypothetical protein
MASTTSPEFDRRAAQLCAVQIKRIQTDPVLCPDFSGPLPADDTPLRVRITPARWNLVRRVPNGERIDVVTWPETSLFLLQSASVNENWARGVENAFCHYAVQQALPEDVLAAHFPDIARHSVLQQHELRKLDKLRGKLRRKQNEHFLEHAYPDMKTPLPKSLWTGHP